MRDEEIADVVLSGGDPWSVVKTMRFGPAAVRAYQAVQAWRMRMFLRGLDDLADELPPEQQQRFEFYVNDAQSARLLADYADTVVRTSSETVIGTLAILYADYENRVMTPEFKAGAIRAFDGLSETRIDAFLQLMESCRANELRPLPESGNYRIFTIGDGSDLTLPQRLRQRANGGDQWVDATSDFITRGLLSPDRTPRGRLGSENATWSCEFTVTADSDAYYDLLRKARTFLRGN